MPATLSVMCSFRLLLSHDDGACVLLYFICFSTVSPNKGQSEASPVRGDGDCAERGEVSVLLVHVVVVGGDSW